MPGKSAIDSKKEGYSASQLKVQGSLKEDKGVVACKWHCALQTEFSGKLGVIEKSRMSKEQWNP